jgi:hypothetical protein
LILVQGRLVMPIQLSERPLSIGMRAIRVARFHCAVEALLSQSAEWRLMMGI